MIFFFSWNWWYIFLTSLDCAFIRSIRELRRSLDLVYCWYFTLFCGWRVLDDFFITRKYTIFLARASLRFYAIKQLKIPEGIVFFWCVLSYNKNIINAYRSVYKEKSVEIGLFLIFRSTLPVKRGNIQLLNWTVQLTERPDEYDRVGGGGGGRKAFYAVTITPQAIYIIYSVYK